MGQSAQVVGTRATGMVVYGSSKVRKTSAKKRAMTSAAILAGNASRKALALENVK